MWAVLEVGINFNYKDLIDVSDNFKMNFKNSGIMKNGRIYTAEVTPKSIRLRKKILDTKERERAARRK